MKRTALEKPILADVARACAELGIGKTLCFEMLARGELTRCKIRGKTLITFESIEAAAARAIARGV